VLGCIFAGSVHDYFSGMLSMRHDGANQPEIIGRYLGNTTKQVMLVFTVFLLMMVGAVFVFSPAKILGDMWEPSYTVDNFGPYVFWIVVIFVYYIIATMLPIDKIIGKIYPLFAFSLLFMAAALTAMLFVKWPSLPEIWEGLSVEALTPKHIFPCLFITIACGAISGFHATQSPLMARCLKNEKLGRPVFYGSMITEGLVALIWAAVSSYFFFDGGAAEVGSDLSAAAPTVVTKVSQSWLGILGGILAVLGVVAAPITSGDTAFRSARLIISDFIKMDQKPVHNRLLVGIPLFLAASALLWFNVANSDGFNIIWRYFGWANQTLAVFALWTATVYLVKHKGGLWYLMTMLPAAFMTAVCTTFICIDKIGFRLPASWNVWIGSGTFLLALGLFFIWKSRRK
jgi:carbon starvation protein CstA